VWVKKNPPPWNFRTFFHNSYYTFPSTLLSATLTKLCHIKRAPPSYAQNVFETHAGCSHLIWHNFVTVGDNQSSSIRIIRIIFLESYARILTYETLSYVNHTVVWYFRPVQGSSSLHFNNETSTQNRNSFAISNTPLLPVYLKQIFLRIPVEGLLFYAVCWLLPTLFGSATPPSGTDAS